MKQNILAAALMVSATLSFSATQSTKHLTASTVGNAAAEGIHHAALFTAGSGIFEKGGENFIMYAAMSTGFNLVDKLMEPQSLEFSKKAAFKFLCMIAGGLTSGATSLFLYRGLAKLFSKKKPERKTETVQKSETSFEPAEVAYFNYLLKKSTTQKT